VVITQTESHGRSLQSNSDPDPHGSLIQGYKRNTRRDWEGELPSTTFYSSQPAPQTRKPQSRSLVVSSCSSPQTGTHPYTSATHTHTHTLFLSHAHQCLLSTEAERERDLDLERERDCLRSGGGEAERDLDRERDTERGASFRLTDCFFSGERLGERERLRERLERFLLRLRLWDLERERDLWDLERERE